MGSANARDDHHPTLRQILSAVVKLSLNALSVRFRRRKQIIFTSSGHQIRGCFYYPRINSKAAGILLLPTAFGLTPHEHSFSAHLAKEGYATLVIAYSKQISGIAVMESELRRKNLEQVVLDGWRVLQEDPLVDADNCAVIGLSLGGYFAMHIATSVKEFGPKAVEVYYGMYALAGTNLPYLRCPLLILQGENDTEDFVENARRVQAISIRDDEPWEVVLYPRTGHQFDLFESGGAAARDAWERTVKFLRQCLGSSTKNGATNGFQRPD